MLAARVNRAARQFQGRPEFIAEWCPSLRFHRGAFGDLTPAPTMRTTSGVTRSLKDARHKTEDALSQAGGVVKTRFGTFFGISTKAPTSNEMMTKQPSAVRAPEPTIPAASPPQPAREPQDEPEPPAAACPVAHKPHEADSQASTVEEDPTMRRHFMTLERLVGMGLSPQAARAALQHLDSWLVSEAGIRDMAAVEGAAEKQGEVILHLNDRVRLEGLVKNSAANGQEGTIVAYGAENQRWKVVLNGSGKAYWIKSKLLRPLELRRLPLEKSGSRPSLAETASPKEAPIRQADNGASTAVKSTASNKSNSPRKRTDHDAELAWRRSQDDREIRLLEKEQELQELQEQLEFQQQLLGERRRHLAMDQARSLAALEQQQQQQRKSLQLTSPPELGGGPSRGHAASFDLGGNSNVSRTEGTVEGEAHIDDDDEGEEMAEDEMWDMDWVTLASGGQAGQAGLVGQAENRVEESVPESPVAAPDTPSNSEARPLRVINLMSDGADGAEQAVPQEASAAGAAAAQEPAAKRSLGPVFSMSMADDDDDDDDKGDAGEEPERQALAQESPAAGAPAAQGPDANVEPRSQGQVFCMSMADDDSDDDKGGASGEAERQATAQELCAASPAGEAEEARCPQVEAKPLDEAQPAENGHASG